MKYFSNKHLLLVLIMSASSQLLAGIKAYTDRQQVHSNETFTLVVELDEYTSDSPDLSVLPKELSILSSSKYHRSSTVNGVSETQLGWKIQLMATEPGVYTIPAIEVENQKSQPIQVTVKQANDSFDSEEKLDAIMLKAELSKDSVYVQEQMVLTIKLFRGIQTQYASLTEPSIENAIIEKLGEDTQYESMIDGQRYLILERKYAIFPQQSGSLSIPPVTFSADVIQKGSSGFGRMLGRTKPVTISTQQQSIDVKPYPENHSGQWLPSEKLSIESRWSDPHGKVEGEPSTWTITLTGVGLHENQLPEIKLPKTDGVKWYPDTAEKTRSISNKGITGKRVERIAVVPTRSGKIELPELSFKWFNTQTGQYETATLPAETIDVQPNSEQSGTSTTITTTPVEQTQSISPQQNSPSAPAGLWRWSTYGFALLWLLTLIYFLLSRKMTPSELKLETAPVTTDAKAALLNAISSKDNMAIYKSLSYWLNDINTQQSFKSHLSALNNDTIKSSLIGLEQSLYGPEKSDWQDAGKLKQWLKIIENDLALNKAANKETKLPPLYPTE